MILQWAPGFFNTDTSLLCPERTMFILSCMLRPKIHALLCIKTDIFLVSHCGKIVFLHQGISIFFRVIIKSRENSRFFKKARLMCFMRTWLSEPCGRKWIRDLASAKAREMWLQFNLPLLKVKLTRLMKGTYIVTLKIKWDKKQLWNRLVKIVQSHFPIYLSFFEMLEKTPVTYYYISYSVKGKYALTPTKAYFLASEVSHSSLLRLIGWECIASREGRTILLLVRPSQHALRPSAWHHFSLVFHHNWVTNK